VNQWPLLKSFLDDTLRQRWGDLVALFLILLGVWLLIHSLDEMVRGEAKGLIGAGLFALRPKTMSSNGNGTTSTYVATVATKSTDGNAAPTPETVKDLIVAATPEVK
jgi:hypothetical protein